MRGRSGPPHEDKVWSRRYQAIPVSDEEPAQVARLAYLLFQRKASSLNVD